MSELEHNYQWNFEVNWCPRNPLLIATSSFDGHTTLYSLSDQQSYNDQVIIIVFNLIKKYFLHFIITFANTLLTQIWDVFFQIILTVLNYVRF